ncbi:Siroheme biosynthesis protein met8 [Cyphellophora attinorum]|uniref:precorrin-2 dehydrogenase n=1 Tax=Cyphellophora attinorum TaxID=1664694 RepID=A0A0N1NW62_9EURO|nr:Siroheme biosynthesis protein met8 [Phialophora attinorum]KPI34725.1 Siroheme biosynthesis protein met8 [Phialophora attinorum]
MPDEFPQVQGGGSLIVAWQIKNKNVLVVGGGEVAAGRILSLLNADARVTVVCPSAGLNAEVRYRVSQRQVTHIDRVFLPLDVEPTKNVAMVLTAIDDPIASTRIWKYCKKLKIPANIADVPPECDFYFGSVHRDGPLQIMVSTNGNGPRIAAAIRRRIADMLPQGTGASIAKVGLLRRKLRKKVPGTGTEDIQRRMAWMSRVCDDWEADDLGELDDEDMAELVSHFETSSVPSFEDIRLKSWEKRKAGVVWDWDGSPGFAI